MQGECWWQEERLRVDATNLVMTYVVIALQNLEITPVLSSALGYNAIRLATCRLAAIAAQNCPLCYCHEEKKYIYSSS